MAVPRATKYLIQQLARSGFQFMIWVRPVVHIGRFVFGLGDIRFCRSVPYSRYRYVFKISEMRFISFEPIWNNQPKDMTATRVNKLRRDRKQLVAKEIELFSMN